MDDRSQTEQAILKAATAVFLEKGRDGARMQEIAERAGINKALLHYYFRSKERLYLEVFRREAYLFFSGLIKSFPMADRAEDFIRGFIYHYMDYLYRYRHIVPFLIWELERGGRDLQAFFDELMDQMGENSIERIIAKIQDAIRAGQMRELDPRHLMFTIIGACLYVLIARPIVEKLFPDIRVMSRDFIDKRKEEIFQTIWNGVKPLNEVTDEDTW